MFGRNSKSIVIGLVSMTLLLCSVPRMARLHSQCPVEPDILAKYLWLFQQSSTADPPDPDSFANFELIVYQGTTEVGRVYRDVAGPRYTEHWVLFPGFRFDSAMRIGESMRIETVASEGYADVDDFLCRVPFPDGSRYVIADCVEFDSLPVKR